MRKLTIAEIRRITEYAIYHCYTEDQIIKKDLLSIHVGKSSRFSSKVSMWWYYEEGRKIFRNVVFKKLGFDEQKHFIGNVFVADYANKCPMMEKVLRNYDLLDIKHRAVRLCSMAKIQKEINKLNADCIALDTQRNRASLKFLQKKKLLDGCKEQYMRDFP